MEMGQYESRVRSLTNAELLSGLSSIVGRRNQITAEFLAYLAELDDRQLFLDLGFASLFEYCVEALGLCESTAGRHIAAARVCRAHSEAFALVASGALHASALSLLRKHLTSDNAAELFELCTRRSARKVEELLAARFPKPDLRDLVRRLPTQTAPTLDVGSALQVGSAPQREPELALESPREPSIERESMSRECPPPEQLAAHTPAPAEVPRTRQLEPLSADRYGVHFTADSEFRELLERVRGLAGHRLPSGDLMTLFKRGLEAYERELSKERFAVGRKARSPQPPNPSSGSNPKPNANSKRKRHRSAAVTRAVYLRDGGQCSYVSPAGRRCSARRCLELDHVDPWAVGGEDTVENLRLRCRAHNQRYARQYFGKARIDAAVKHARRRHAASAGQP